MRLPAWSNCTPSPPCCPLASQLRVSFLPDISGPIDHSHWQQGTTKTPPVASSVLFAKLDAGPSEGKQVYAIWQRSVPSQGAELAAWAACGGSAFLSLVFCAVCSDQGKHCLLLRLYLQLRFCLLTYADGGHPMLKGNPMCVEHNLCTTARETWL